MKKIDYEAIYKIVLSNKKKGISVKDTLKKEIGYSNNGNFYKNLTESQKKALSNAKKLTEKQKKEIIDLYLNHGKTMTFLRQKYKVRTKTIIDLINGLSGEYSRSYKNHRRKLTKYQVIKILIERMKYGATHKALSEKYNVSESCIWHICNGYDWKHIFQGVKKKYNKEILSMA